MYNTATLPDTTQISAQIIGWTFSLIFLAMFVVLLAVFAYMLIQLLKYRNREKYALDFVSLKVRLPKDNEIKIDAAEQMFASLYSLKKNGWFSWMQAEDS